MSTRPSGPAPATPAPGKLPLTELADSDLLTHYTDAIARVQHAVDDGRPADGAWILIEEVALATDEERAMASAAHRFAADVMRPAGIALDHSPPEAVVKYPTMLS